MKMLLLHLYLVATITVSAQVNNEIGYDSLDNIPGKLKAIYGQSALVLNLNELYKSKKDLDRYSDYSVINQHFNIISATYDDVRPQIWLTLGSADDTIHFRLTNKSKQSPPFITIGFLEKHKSINVNKKFRLKIDTDLLEINSGVIQAFNRGEIFTCRDIELINRDGELVPSYILVNDNSKIEIPLKGFEKDSDNSMLRFDIL